MGMARWVFFALRGRWVLGATRWEKSGGSVRRRWRCDDMLDLRFAALVCEANCEATLFYYCDSYLHVAPL